ncbi:DNA repair protein RecO [Pelagibius litoralis]|uniref:DNA repair protein RecO n=1 Tax=Pelagibius litoralis TaxID=374515 RepID=A0A967C4C8_9PROT|nr:DNA repair protein RecO [Pelagibius litoralis]NIA67001.1 DNA repair protein RecO [Pelagibius litoralis]
MKWEDEAVVLAARPHGETSTVVQLLTRFHGRHAGLVRGGQGARLRGLYQAGNLVTAVWSGRLAEHLGNFECELARSYAAEVMDDPDRLAALVAAAAVCEGAMPEREPHPACYVGLLALLDALEGDHWAEVYVRWETGLLAELGFGLDLSRCAGGGDNDQLSYVSPKSGRAVSLSAGAPFKERLLSLPGFLLGRGEGGAREVAEGLELTGFFLERHLFHSHDKPLPKARQRLAQRFAKDELVSVHDRRAISSEQDP